MMGMAMRKQKTGIPKKIAEVRSIGDAANKPEFQKYAPSPELIWDNLEDCDSAFPLIVRASAKSNNLFLDTYFQTL